jgi:hypothetical protein
MLNARCPLQTRYSKPAPDLILGRCWNVAAKRTRRAFATQSCRRGAPGSRRSKTARSGDEVVATTQAMACRCTATWQCAVEVPRQQPVLALPAPGRLFVTRRGGPSVQDAILSHFDSNFHTQLDRDVKCHRPTWSSATGPAWISEQHLRQSPPPNANARQSCRRTLPVLLCRYRTSQLAIEAGALRAGFYAANLL